MDFIPIENFETTLPKTKTTSPKKTAARHETNENLDVSKGLATPRQLDNGKWACNHKCKDKTSYVLQLLLTTG
jgi:ATP-dependent DNA helicase HFM1/MER3